MELAGSKDRTGSSKNAFIHRSQRCGRLRCIADVATDKTAGEIAPSLSRHGSPEQPVAELTTDLIDNSQIGQQCRNIGWVNVAPRRHGARATLGKPIVIEVEVMGYRGSCGHAYSRLTVSG